MAAVLDPCMNTFTSTYHPFFTSSSTYAHIFHIGRTHPLAMIHAYETKTNTPITTDTLRVFKYTEEEMRAVERAQKALTRWRQTRQETSQSIRQLIEQERDRVAQKAKIAAMKEVVETETSTGRLCSVVVAEEECAGEETERGRSRQRTSDVEGERREGDRLHEALTSPAKFSDGAKSIVSCWEIQNWLCTRGRRMTVY